MNVDCYFNLHKKVWSIRDRKTRRVIGHAKTVGLRDVTFRVSEPGRQRVLRDKRKNVHAFASGELVSFDGTELVSDLGRPVRLEDLEAVSYNPYKAGHFYRKADDAPVHSAELVMLAGRGVYASNIA